MGSGVASEWRNWILFSNASEFGVKDPQFHKDIGFYVFRLPFLQFIAGWTFAALLVVLIITAVFHYLNGGIRLQTPFQRVTPQVKVHISVILALMALTKTVQYYLARYALTLSHRGTVDGATYTDVKAQLPALNLLDADLGRGRVPVHREHLPQGLGLPDHRGRALGLHLDRGRHDLSRDHPALRGPAERVRTRGDLHQAQHRRDACGVRARRHQDQVTSTTPKPMSVKQDIVDSKTTLDNVRLWDPTGDQGGNSATQEFQPYYQVLRRRRRPLRRERCARAGAHGSCASSTPRSIPSTTWTNRHLVYTHGFGVDGREGELAQAGLSPTTSSPTFRPTGERST